MLLKVRVTVWGALVVAASCGPNVRLVGESETAKAVPVPVRGTVRFGMPGAGS